MTTLDILENLKEKSLNYMKLEARMSKTHFAFLFSVYFEFGLSRLISSHVPFSMVRSRLHPTVLF